MSALRRDLLGAVAARIEAANSSAPEGFWLDSYDYASFRRHVLEPFEPGGSLQYRRAIRDVSADHAVGAAVEYAPA
ncbi:MAG TPA: hypothetical protein VFZ85_04995 [Jiangellaceae bacterium]